MGSDNEKRRRSGPLPLFRLLVALLGISLLVFFTARVRACARADCAKLAECTKRT